VTVVSGGAYGSTAPRTAPLSRGGATVAIMAGGVDRAYPAGHRDLIERIVREGLVVAEVPCGTTHEVPLARNRLIAALSDATVVVEAVAQRRPQHGAPCTDDRTTGRPCPGR
jgi:DNA processing protein